MADATSNGYEVLNTYPSSESETVVTGFVVEGTIRKGSWATFNSADGSPVTGQILRVGTADAPLNLIREGQKDPIVVGVESRHIRPGMVIRTHDEEQFAPTMLLTMMAPAQRGELEVPPDDLVAIEQMVHERKFRDAMEKLGEHAPDPKYDHVVKRLKARIYIESDEDRDVAEALRLIRAAYDGDGGRDADVIEVLARALGENGDAANGLRYLVRLYNNALDLDSRAYYKDKVESHRRRFSIPDQWDVLDAMGEVIFTSGDPKEIAKAYRANRFPDGSRVRKNRVGDLVDIEKFSNDAVTAKSGQDGAIDNILSNLPADQKRKKAIKAATVKSRTAQAPDPSSSVNPIAIGAGAIIGGGVGAAVAGGLGQSLAIFAIGGVIVGAGIGFAAGMVIGGGK